MAGCKIQESKKKARRSIIDKVDIEQRAVVVNLSDFKRLLGCFFSK